MVNRFIINTKLTFLQKSFIVLQITVIIFTILVKRYFFLLIQNLIITNSKKQKLLFAFKNYVKNVKK